MSESTSVPVVSWSVERCTSCGRLVAVLRAENGSALRLRLTTAEALWLTRGRHPAYALHLRPMIEGLARRALWLEFNNAESGAVSSSVVAAVDQELRRGHISPALAMLMLETGLPLYVDESLLSRSKEEHVEEVVGAFVDFLATVSAEDFARFDTGNR